MNETKGVRSTRLKFKAMRLAPLLAIIALLCWALASPVGSSPDDDFHLPSIWCAAGNKVNQCQAVADQSQRAVPKTLGKERPCFARIAIRSAACQGASSAPGQDHLVTTTRGNFQGLYPSPYYQTMNLFVGPSVELSVVLMRLVNILLLVGLTTVLYVLLPVSRRLPLVWGLAISLVPLGMFLVASNNPSAWAVISAGTLWISLVGYFESSGAKKAVLGIIAALSTVLGAGARADAAIYAVVAVVVAVLLTASRDRRWVISALLPIGLVITAAVFYLSAQQSSVGASGIPGYPDGDPTHPLQWRYLFFTNLLNVPSLWAGVFGSWPLGWLDTVMPAAVWVASLGCFAALVFTGLASMSIRKLLVVVTVLGALVLIPVYVLVQSRVFIPVAVQPRYILPLVIMLAGVILWQAGGARLRLSKGQVITLVSTLSVVNAIALHFNMRRYITGSDVTDINLNTAVEWWWNFSAPPMTVWVAGSFSFAALLVILAKETMLAPAALPHQETSSGCMSRDPAEAEPGLGPAGVDDGVSRACGPGPAEPRAGIQFLT